MAQSPRTTRSIRTHNLALVQQTLLRDGPLSRAAIARRTGLSRPSVSTLVERLIDENLIVEYGAINDGSGRPAQPVDLNRSAMRLIGIEVGATFIESVVTDLDGKQLKHDTYPVPVRTEPEMTIAFLNQLLTSLINDIRSDRGLVLGVGIGLASPISGPQSNTFAQSLYPAWAEYELGTALTRSLDVPIMFENDANLGAVGEFVWGTDKVKNLAYIKLDSGIGSGHLVNGLLMTGTEGLAGEIGHMFADPDAGECYCGGYGCLVKVLGLDALKVRVAEFGWSDKTEDTYDALALAAVKDDTKHRYQGLCKTLSTALAKSLAGIIAITNPQKIILGGQGAHLPHLAELTEATLRKYLSDVTRPKLIIEVTPAERPTVALGGCALVRESTSQLSCFGVDASRKTDLAS
ncbi:MAG: ROK family transcriptional regulator [Bradymonadia bacterium]